MLRPIDNYNIIDRLYINYHRSNHHLVISRGPRMDSPCRCRGTLCRMSQGQSHRHGGLRDGDPGGLLAVGLNGV